MHECESICWWWNRLLVRAVGHQYAPSSRNRFIEIWKSKIIINKFEFDEPGDAVESIDFELELSQYSGEGPLSRPPQLDNTRWDDLNSINNQTNCQLNNQPNNIIEYSTDPIGASNYLQASSSGEHDKAALNVLKAESKSKAYIYIYLGCQGPGHSYTECPPLWDRGPENWATMAAKLYLRILALVPKPLDRRAVVWSQLRQLSDQI